MSSFLIKLMVDVFMCCVRWRKMIIDKGIASIKWNGVFAVNEMMPGCEWTIFCAVKRKDFAHYLNSDVDVDVSVSIYFVPAIVTSRSFGHLFWFE